MMTDLIRVLLVQEDIGDRQLVEQLLDMELKPVIFDIESVRSLASAVELLALTKYDILLLFLRYADSAGLEAVRHLCSVHPSLPVVVLKRSSTGQIGPLVMANNATSDSVKEQSLKDLLVRRILYALERKKQKALLFDANLRMQETCQDLFVTKQALEKTISDLSKTNERLEREILLRKNAEKELQTNKKDFHNLILSSPDGILIVDREGIIQFVNPAAESLFGYKVEELLGQTFGFPIVKNEVTEIDIVRSNKEVGVAEMKAAQTEWNNHSCCMIAIHDITLIKRANAKLEEYNQLKDEFVSTASHELRTPLTIIMGAIRLVLDEIPGKIVEEQRVVLATAMKSVERLGRIVDSLLNISKIESGKLDLHKNVVNICEIVKDMVCNCTSLSREKGIRLDYEIPQAGVDICVDQDRIKEVLINLISNSVKFTPKGGWIKVTCTRQDHNVLLSVQDSGVGIASEDIPKLFDKFTQFGRKAGPGEKGTGLGLAIVKKLVEMHEGTIEAQSEVGHGATFTVSLPLTTEAATEGMSVEIDELVEQTVLNN